jgi:hypothetical protein
VLTRGKNLRLGHSVGVHVLDVRAVLRTGRCSPR